MKVGITILPRTASVLCVALLLQFSSGTFSCSGAIRAILVSPIALYLHIPARARRSRAVAAAKSNLQGPQLVDAACQQNWHPSIQALVVFRMLSTT